MLQEAMEDNDFLKVSSARCLNDYINKPILMEGFTAAPTLPWWQKLELNDYLRNSRWIVRLSYTQNGHLGIHGHDM
jgi:hypothetical protein